MTSGPPTSDPIALWIVQPMVDRLSIDPRAAAEIGARLMIAIGLTLCTLKAATMDQTILPAFHLQLVLHVVGVVIVSRYIRFCAGMGPAALLGPVGALHLGLRMLLAYCLVQDVIELHALSTSDLQVSTISMVRSMMQAIEDVTVLGSLYLCICRNPPPSKTMRDLIATHA